MTRRRPVVLLCLAATLAWGVSTRPVGTQTADPPPNVIFILADDLGYGDLGSYGQRVISTPNLDRLAREGVRFTQFYAGSTVCAPSRAVLMTGRHMGHVSVRGNAPQERIDDQALRRGERTVAHVFKDAGYATALFGKWGLGEVGSEGHPNRMGFDEFFGFLSQFHAHNYYPTFLVHNSTRYPLRNVAESQNAERGDGWAREKVDYAPDVIFEKSLEWIDQHRRDPFFLYLATTIPHANNEAAAATGDGQEVPDYGIYADRPWPNPDKGQAAMITRLDAHVGRLMATLAAAGLERNTLLIFSSDNGPHQEGRNDIARFSPSGPLRGIKRSLYEGGIRVPFIARWPGRIAPGTSSAHLGYFGDMIATVGELTNRPVPDGLDSISVLPALLGRPQPEHEYLYFEFYEQGGRQAVRFGDWKAIREPMITGPLRLYDLSTDLGETTDLALARPDLVRRAATFMNEAHVDDPRWRVQ